MSDLFEPKLPNICLTVLPPSDIFFDKMKWYDYMQLALSVTVPDIASHVAVSRNLTHVEPVIFDYELDGFYSLNGERYRLYQYAFISKDDIENHRGEI